MKKEERNEDVGGQIGGYEENENPSENNGLFGLSSKQIAIGVGTLVVFVILMVAIFA